MKLNALPVFFLSLLYSAASVYGHEEGISEFFKRNAMALDSPLFPRASATYTTDGTCGNTGAGTKGYHCAASGENLCCSYKGYCGDTDNHCGTGCQSTFGICHPTSSSTSPSTPTSAATSSSPTTTKVTECGSMHNNQVCTNNDCCSPAGFCGSTSAYCASPDCLLPFGRCDSSTTPSGLNTSTLPRPALGSVPYGTDLYHCTAPGTIALTYDDGPYNYTTQLLDTLLKYNASATFMVTGNNKGKGEIDVDWTSAIQRMWDEGHQIASHTWSHLNLSQISADMRRAEMVKNEMAFRNILGRWPSYMRPPYSACDDACREDMVDLGYHITYFDLDTDDYDRSTPTKIQGSKDIFGKKIDAADPSTDKFLVIGHDIDQQTATNLTDYMLSTLLAKGFRPVTVGECLDDPRENWYRNDTRAALQSDGSATGIATSSSSGSPSTSSGGGGGGGGASQTGTQTSSGNLAADIKALQYYVFGAVFILAFGVWG